MLISLPLLRSLSLKNSRICNIPKDLGQGAVEDFRPFSMSWWVFPLLCFRFGLYGLFCLWWFCYGLASNTCFLAAGRVPVMELYVGLWDVLMPRGIPIGFEKLFGLGFWLCNRFSRRSSS